jgi:hypothetical protein
MAPKETSLVLGMVSLLLHFRWTWVGLFISEDHRGLQILSDLREEMDKHRICVAFVEMIPVSTVSFFPKIWSKHHQIIKSSANVIILYGDSDFLEVLMNTLQEILMTGKVWVLNSQWDLIRSHRHLILDSFHGQLSFSHHHGDISGFRNFIQSANPSKYPEDFYLASLFLVFLGCSFSESHCGTYNKCPHNASLTWLPGNLFETAMSEESHNIYNAVYAVAHTLHEMLLHQIQMQTVGKGKWMEFSPSQVMAFSMGGT